MPAALPSTLNTAGDVSHMKYGPNELVYWVLQCKEHEEVNITWTSFDIGNDSLWMVQRESGVWTTFFNASGLDTVEDFTFTSAGSTFVVFTSEAGSDGGDFAFRYECLSTPAPPTAEPPATPTGAPTALADRQILTQRERLRLLIQTTRALCGCHYRYQCRCGSCCRLRLWCSWCAMWQGSKRPEHLNPLMHSTSTARRIPVLRAKSSRGVMANKALCRGKNFEKRVKSPETDE